MKYLSLKEVETLLSKPSYYIRENKMDLSYYVVYRVEGYHDCLLGFIVSDIVHKLDLIKVEVTLNFDYYLVRKVYK